MQTTPQIDLARKFIELTASSIFLTGKAGTGKTTFLRELREHSPKRMIVVAPTGVAAMNAGGVTIHSFFQLPFGPYLPAMQQAAGGEMGRLKMNFSKEKISIIRSIDLLVIDEISMVRADLLDAINDVLQRYRDRTKPFGGVQLLMIGDLQQLAPVVKPQEWSLIHEHYRSPFFFDSKALRSTQYITIELQHIFRQNDSAFIDILNRVRENNLDASTLRKLNERYIHNFEAPEQAGYITLTAHNHAANTINERRLEALTTPAYTFACQTQGDFPEYLYPNDSLLTLKRDAQVMFLKNDTSGLHRYYNGKIGRVSEIDQEHIEVVVDDQREPIQVEIGEWSNAKYVIDPQTQEITESIEGVFRQYPLKTAWAITIHKSQGLTFERAIIDAADSFSHGQVYVALSRCRSFEGLVLRTPLPGSAIISDPTIAAYNKYASENQPNEQQLTEQSRLYCRSLMLEMFDFEPLRIRLSVVAKLFGEHLLMLYPKLTAHWHTTTTDFAAQVTQISRKFHQQILQIAATDQAPHRSPQLMERIAKAQVYFLEKCRNIVTEVVDQSGNIEIDNKESRKLLTDALKRLREVLAVKLAVLEIDFGGEFAISTYLSTRAKAAITPPQTKPAKRSKTEKVTTESTAEDIENPELFELLRAWRKQVADREHLPVYVVMQQKALLAACQLLPRNSTELGRIKGIGKVFLANYGAEVLSIIDQWCEGTQQSL